MYEYRKPFCNGLAFTSFIYQTCCIKKQISYILFQFVCVYEHIKYISSPIVGIHWVCLVLLCCVVFHKGKAKKPPNIGFIFYI